jgi:hypothetical protein
MHICRRALMEGLCCCSLLLLLLAAYGGHAAVADLGLQIFVTLRKGKSWPPSACDVRYAAWPAQCQMLQ